MAAAKVLRWAIVGLCDETMVLLKANVVWFLASLPLALPLLTLLIAVLPPTGEDDARGLVLPLLTSGFLLLLVPSPASLGLYRLAATMQRKESPPWHYFWDATRHNLRLGLALYVIGLGGLFLLAVVASFYLRVEQLPLQALSVVYIYLGLFWLALQLYLGPLAMFLGERRLVSLYRRAALLVLAHPTYSITFLLSIALVVLLSLIMVPLLPTIAMAFVALVGTRALAELKRKYDPQPDPDEEVA